MKSKLNVLEENYYPRIAVLMATYNGLQWIQEQLDSILMQENVDITLYISDDGSSDGTDYFLLAHSHADPRVVILPKKASTGATGQNFYRLIREVNTSSFDYVAFADQDDIWHKDKLINHIKLLSQYQADAVSSNVIAFWPDSTERLIVKSQPQRSLDFIFESAGPGCSFLMTPWLIAMVREQLIDINSQARYVELHDWLTYAICRAHGASWIIDSRPSLRYRQHHKNVIGANIGLKSKFIRLIKLHDGRFRAEVEKIAQVCTLISKDLALQHVYRLVKYRSVVSNFRLLGFVGAARRSFVDRLGLTVCIVLHIF